MQRVVGKTPDLFTSDGVHALLAGIIATVHVVLRPRCQANTVLPLYRVGRHAHQANDHVPPACAEEDTGVAATNTITNGAP